MWWPVVCCLVMCIAQQVLSEETAIAKPNRIALVVTLAGNRKLAQYFEWSCRTIVASKSMVDMLVFHENNQKLGEMKCAENVKFINLGDRGLSTIIAKQVLGDSIKEDVLHQLEHIINNVLVHSPRYLVEIKPMIGSLFAGYLSSYTHWTYSDPDIVWGNIADSLEESDLEQYDIISFAKHMDAARLFLRGQFALHKNNEVTNALWKKLEYFEHDVYATRMGIAFRMLSEKKSTDEVFNANFHSAEGWYSKVAFSSGLKIKIVGVGFDDFFREPVIWRNGRLSRCTAHTNMTTCIETLERQGSNTTIRNSLPAPVYEPVTAYNDEAECKMFWLPIETRLCVATPSYDKGDALVQDKQTDVKLDRVGEVVLMDGKWKANDEMKSARQVKETAALFHFRHWDDFIATSQSVTWGEEKTKKLLSCMVLYLRYDKALAFEDCNIVKEKELTRRMELSRVIDTRDEMGRESVSKILSHRRWENEVGVRNTHSSPKEEVKDPIGPPSDHDREVMMHNKEKRAKEKRGGKSLRGRGGKSRRQKNRVVD